MTTKGDKGRAPFKFYLGLLLFFSASLIGYLSVYGFIRIEDYGNLGEFGIHIYIFAMISIPISCFRLLKAVQIEFNNNHMAFWSMGLPFAIVCIFLSLSINANAIVFLFFGVYGWAWIPMSWYDFKEGRWNKK